MYNFSCTSTDGEGSCTELLPANTTSFTLSVAAGDQYTIIVSAWIDGTESRKNPNISLGKFSVCYHSGTIFNSIPVKLHSGILSQSPKLLHPSSLEYSDLLYVLLIFDPISPCSVPSCTLEFLYM